MLSGMLHLQTIKIITLLIKRVNLFNQLEIISFKIPMQIIELDKEVQESQEALKKYKILI